jgi:hydroxysqualene dehydroxylase
MKVAIIGGGWAGLAAAVELTAGGAQVTLFEAGQTLGGRARSVSVQGQILDNGQHILLGAYRETLSLMQRVGVNPEHCLQRLPLTILDNAGFHLALPQLPAPFHLALGLITAKGIGFRDKIKAAWWMDRLKRQGFNLPADSTVSAWLDAGKQQGAIRRQLWEPLCLAALNTPAQRASAQIFANVLKDSLGSPHRSDTDFLIPKRPLGELLPEPAKIWLEAHGTKIHLSHRVNNLVGTTVDGERFDAVIVAVSPHHAPKLLPGSNPLTAFEPIATVYLQFDQAVQLPFPLVNLSSGIGQWTVDRGNGLIACVLSGHGTGNSSWETLNNAELVNVLCSELTVFGICQQPLWHKIIIEKRATFSCQPNLVRPTIKTTHPKVFQIGDHTWAKYPATLEGAVRSGLFAAQQLLNPDSAPPI